MRDLILRIVYTKLYAVVSLLLTAVLIYIGYSSDNRTALTIGMFLLGFNTVIAFNTKVWTMKYIKEIHD